MRIVRISTILTLSIYISLFIGNYIFQQLYIKSNNSISDNMMAYMIYNDYTGFQTKPNAIISHSNYKYKTDNYGFRNPNFKRDFKKKLVILLGDSHVWGWGKQDKGLISSKLMNLLSKDYQVFNIADIGFSSLQTFLMMDKLFLELKPNYVFWINGHNDNYNNTRKFEYSLSKPILGKENSCISNYIPLRPLHFSRNQKLNHVFVSKNTELQFLPWRWDLSKFLTNIVQDILYIEPQNLRTNFLGQLAHCQNQISEQDVNGDDQLVFLNKALEQNLKKRGIYYASLIGPNKKLYTTNQDYNYYLKEQFKSQNLKLIDLNKEITVNPNQVYMTPLNHDDDHYSEKYHELIARVIFEVMQDTSNFTQP